MPVVGRLADAVQEIDADIVFGFGQLHLAREGMDVPDKGCRNLAKALVWRLRHGLQDHWRHIFLGIDDASETLFPIGTRRYWAHGQLPASKRPMQSFAFY